MNKGKAVKLGAAATIASVGLVTVAPQQSEAAASLSQKIAEAKAAYKKPYHTYSKATGLADPAQVKAEIAEAGKVRANIINEINKSSLSTKSKEAKKQALDKMYNKYVTDRAQGYVSGYNYAKSLQKNLNAKIDKLIAGAAESKGSVVKKYYHDTLAKANEGDKKIKSIVYGGTIKNRLLAEFTLPIIDALDNDLKVALYLVKVEYWINKGDIKTALDRYHEIEGNLNSFDTTTKIGKAITTYGKSVYSKLELFETTKVISVNGINAKTIEVTFNKAIDPNTLKYATGQDSITIVPSAGASSTGTVKQELSADGKKLILKASELFKGEYTVKVPFEQVKDTAGIFVAPVNAKVTVNDKAAPVLQSAAATVKDTQERVKELTLTFNEEVVSIDTVKMNGKNYDAIISGSKATVKVDLEASKAYEIMVVNAKDAAGNVKDVQVVPLSIVIDNIAPSIVQVVPAGENKVTVTLNKELEKDHLVISAKVGSITTNAVETIEVNPENKKEYTITLNTDYLFKNGNTETVQLIVAKEALVDGLGNKNDTEITKSIVLAKDTSTPQVVKVTDVTTVDQVSSFSVSYSKDIAKLDQTKVTVVNSKGEILLVSNVVAKIAIAEDKRTVVFTLVNGFVADKYSFELAAGFVTDYALTPNSSGKSSFDVNTIGAPIETTFTIKDATAEDNAITVDFGEKVKAIGAGYALNPNAYQVNGAALPANTLIEFLKEADGQIDQSKVQITLPADFITMNDEKAIFQVNGVETLDHKVSKPFTRLIKVEDNTAPVPHSFTHSNANTIEVTYSEAIQLIGENPDLSDEIKLLDASGNSIPFTNFVVLGDKLYLTISSASKVASLTTLQVQDLANANIVDLNKLPQKGGVEVK